MAIRVNDNGTVVIERVLKVTKELETSDFSSFALFQLFKLIWYVLDK